MDYYLHPRKVAVTFGVICKWPEGFFQLIDQLKAQQHDNSHKYGLFHDFGKPFIEGMKRNFLNDEFEFIREAFEDYLSNWDAGYITSKNKWYKSIEKRSDLIGFEQARRMLNVDTNRINKWIEHGILKAKVINSGKRRMILLKMASVERLSEDRLTWKSLPETAAILNIHPDIARDLVRANILRPASGQNVDGFDYTYIKYNDTKRLLHQLFQVLCSNRPEFKTRNLICFKKAAYLLKLKKYSQVKFIQMVLSAEIIPCAIGQSAGLNCFLFNEKQIQRIKDLKELSLNKSEMTVAQAAKRLGLSRDSVQGLIRIGILSAKLVKGYKRLLSVDINSIEFFEHTYIVANQLASKFSLHTNKLNALLKNNGIEPVSGPGTDGCPISLLNKKDIDKIDLDKLVK